MANLIKAVNGMVSATEAGTAANDKASSRRKEKKRAKRIRKARAVLAAESARVAERAGHYAYKQGEAQTYYVEDGVDHLDVKAQRILVKLVRGEKVEGDELTNLIRNLLHERRWMRGEVRHRKRRVEDDLSDENTNKTEQNETTEQG